MTMGEPRSETRREVATSLLGPELLRDTPSVGFGLLWLSPISQRNLRLNQKTNNRERGWVGDGSWVSSYIRGTIVSSVWTKFDISVTNFVADCVSSTVSLSTTYWHILEIIISNIFKCTLVTSPETTETESLIFKEPFPVNLTRNYLHILELFTFPFIFP